MNDILRAMREHALTDAAFRQAILATQNAADPLTALCELAQANGFNLTLADIISDGEEFPATRRNPPTAATQCPTIVLTIPTKCFCCRCKTSFGQLP